MPNVTIIYRRDELYQQVWARPMREVAKDYGVSDGTLANACRKLNVPRPSNGYWAKKAAGHAVKQIPLPEPRAGRPTELRVTRWKGPRPAKPAPKRSGAQAPADREKKAAASFSIEVPEVLERPHRLVGSATKGLKRGRVNREGLLEPRGEIRLAVKVSPAQVDRSMRLLDTLFKAVEKAGHKVIASEGYDKPARFMVDGEEIAFSMRERLVRSDHIPRKDEIFSPKWDYRPSGDLQFKLVYDKWYRSTTEWKDSKRSSLEAQADAIFQGIIQASLDAKELREKRRELERQQAEEARLRWEREQRKKEEERRIAELVEMANQWERSTLLRRFLGAVREEAVRRLGAIEPGSPAADWFEMAETIATKLDPIPRLFEPRSE